MWESRVLRRAFERLELHEGKLSRAVLRGGGGGDVTSLPDHLGGQPPKSTRPNYPPTPIIPRGCLPGDVSGAGPARWLDTPAGVSRARGRCHPLSGTK